MSQAHSLYITLQFLRVVDGEYKYHWGLWATGDAPPQGALFHATDTNRAPLDLFYDTRTVKNPEGSQSMIVCLKIADAPSPSVIHRIVSAVPLMDRSKLPKREVRWTCRVWVKEALRYMETARMMRLPTDIDTIEDLCLHTANKYVPLRIDENKRGQVPALKKPRIFNQFEWLIRGTNPTIPMDIDTSPHPVQRTHYGSTPRGFETAPSRHPDRYYGPKPMVIDSTSSHPTGQRHYRSDPMDIDSTGRYGTSYRRAY